MFETLKKPTRGGDDGGYLSHLESLDSVTTIYFNKSVY